MSRSLTDSKQETSYRGLQGQIKYVEETIAIKKQLGKDASFEEGLVKEWRKYLPGGSKHYLWVAYSREGSHQKTLATPTKSNSGRSLGEVG